MKNTNKHTHINPFTLNSGESKTKNKKSLPTEAIPVLNASTPVKITQGQLCRYMYIGSKTVMILLLAAYVLTCMCWNSITVGTGSYISEVDQWHMRAMD